MDLDQLIAPALQRERPQDYALWPEHALAWRVYLGCATQWRWAALGLEGCPMCLGLDYPGVEVVMRRCRVPPELEEEVFEQLQVLEQETVLLRNQHLR